jgi:hypothetical protein
LYETPRNEQLQQQNGNYQVNNQQMNTTSILPHQKMDSIHLPKMLPTKSLLLEQMGIFSKEHSATIVRHMGTMLVIVMSPKSAELL